jgi:hypothetical protein
MPRLLLPGAASKAVPFCRRDCPGEPHSEGPLRNYPGPIEAWPKFHCLIKFPLADGLRFRVVERIDPLGDRLLSLKLLLGLAENGLSELDLLPKPLLELNRRIGCARTQRLDGFAALLHGVFGQLGHLREFFVLSPCAL